MWRKTKNLLYNLDPEECNTVLVLGAGASAHLKFPLGRELCNNIIKNTSDPSSESYNKLLEMGFPGEQIQTFSDQMSKSSPDSIDEFLSDRENFLKIGRATIAQLIISCEDERRLQCKENNWYGLLRKQIKKNIEANRYSPVIVTFNYDLSLDKYLFDFISSTCRKCESINSLEGIVRILHVHGALGEVNRGTFRLYGQAACACPSYIKTASEGIRVPSELGSGYGDDMVIARETIEKASRVIFLGFGYEKANLAHLGVDNPRTGTKWEGKDKYFGTAYNLPEPRQIELKTRSEGRLSLENQTIFDYSRLRLILNEREAD